MQALGKQGCAVDFVGGSSSVLVVGGRCLPGSGASPGAACGSNLSVWDTMAPAASACVGRLAHHQVGEGRANRRKRLFCIEQPERLWSNAAAHAVN